MGQHFDPETMALPPFYLIKQGFFSQGTKFDQVFMKYGRQNISVTFNSLSSNSEYAVFYFVTVDNPSLSSRHSEV